MRNGLHVLTVFLCAFLLFVVQPMIGKALLPAYGGSASVWLTCMLFFQFALLAGYVYAHGLTSLPQPRTRGVIHAILVFVCLLHLPLSAGPDLPPAGSELTPIRALLAALGRELGLPALLLAASSPLLQRWFLVLHPGKSPYRLYAVSNLGSMLGLLAYPLLAEPFLRSDVQAGVWSILFATACVLSLLLAYLVAGSPAEGSASPLTPAPPSPGSAEGGQPRPGVARTLLWFGLSTAASVHLLATTSQLTREVASVPFLWILPLALYLQTFISSFRLESGPPRGRMAVLLLCSIVVANVLLRRIEQPPLWIQIPGYLVVLYACCMACHGELVRTRPDPRHLTWFYLVLSTGGFAGGVFATLIAPRIFTGYWEYECSLAACWLLAPLSWLAVGAPPFRIRRPALVICSFALAWLAAAGYLAERIIRFEVDSVERVRNFYGVMRVIRSEDRFGPRHSLLHGRVVHGFQYLDPELRGRVTAYYAPGSGADLVMRGFKSDPEGGPPPGREIAVIGLGTGTMAAMAREGDRITYYEIDPDVVRIARTHFTYLDDSPAEIAVTLGDARIMMERELAGGGGGTYDILAVDAFSSDAIPVHLLTREAFDVYLRMIRPDGLILMHISNQNVSLERVVRALAIDAGLEWRFFHRPADPAEGILASRWMVIAGSEVLTASPEIGEAWGGKQEKREPVLWTDDFSSLLPVLRF